MSFPGGRCSTITPAARPPYQPLVPTFCTKLLYQKLILISTRAQASRRVIGRAQPLPTHYRSSCPIHCRVHRIRRLHCSTYLAFITHVARRVYWYKRPRRPYCQNAGHWLSYHSEVVSISPRRRKIEFAFESANRNTRSHEYTDAGHFNSTEVAPYRCRNLHRGHETIAQVAAKICQAKLSIKYRKRRTPQCVVHK